MPFWVLTKTWMAETGDAILWFDLIGTWPIVDTTTPARKTMFQMLGVFAEFERFQEPVRAGLQRAGKQLGWPSCGYNQCSPSGRHERPQDGCQSEAAQHQLHQS
jgi:DNA invertase Pin-like site-specific DNA recombinase